MGKIQCVSQKQRSPITSKPEIQKYGVSSEIKGYDKSNYSYLLQHYPTFHANLFSHIQLP